MISPRAQFTMHTFGFILANASAFNMPRVCSVTGMWTVMKSASINRVQIRQLHANRFGAAFREKRIVGEHPHSKRQRALGDFAADPAHAENAECLAEQFRALKLFAIPFAGEPLMQTPAAPSSQGSEASRTSAQRS